MGGWWSSPMVCGMSRDRSRAGVKCWPREVLRSFFPIIRAVTIVSRRRCWQGIVRRQGRRSFAIVRWTSAHYSMPCGMERCFLAVFSILMPWLWWVIRGVPPPRFSLPVVCRQIACSRRAVLISNIPNETSVGCSSAAGCPALIRLGWLIPE